MTTTFPAINVGSNSSRKKGQRVLQADFGDGYSQVIKDGLNTEMESWDISFDGYPIADVTTVTDFLDARGSVESFFWTPPDEVTAKLWRQEGEYNVSFDGPLTRSLKFSIKRVYIP